LLTKGECHAPDHYPDDSPYRTVAACGCPAAREREVLQNQLEHPWALAFLPDDRGILMTLRGGELRLWQRDKGLAPAISGVPQVWANGQGAA
jgi:glucose/arabinose dehydrogenase